MGRVRKQWTAGGHEALATALDPLGLAGSASRVAAEARVAGGLNLLTREHLADAGVPRHLRGPVLDVLLSPAETIAARRSLAACIDVAPPYVADAMRLVLSANDPASRLYQAMFGFAAIARYVAMSLLSPHLPISGPEIAPALSGLARPTLGQVWAASRYLAHLQWSKSPEAALASSFLKVDSLAAPASAGNGRLVDRLLAQRNALAHGATVLDQRESALRELGVLESLVLTLKTLAFEGMDGPAQPVIDHADGELGILEGWDLAKQTLHFVGPHRTWSSRQRDRWDQWVAVLQRTGVASIPLKHLTRESLERRAAATAPRFMPRGVQFPSPLDGIVDTRSPSVLRGRDPWFAAALLHQQIDGPVFVCDARKLQGHLPPALALSQLMGLTPSLVEADPCSAATETLQQSSLILVEPPPTTIDAWKTLCLQLGGPRTWFVLRDNSEDSLPSVGHLAAKVYEAVRIPLGGARSYAEITTEERELLTTYRRIAGIALRTEPPQRGDRTSALLTHLEDGLAFIGTARAAESLSVLFTSGAHRIDEQLETALAAMDFVSTSPDSRPYFVDVDAEHAARLYVCAHGTHRVVRTVIEGFEPAASPAEASIRSVVFRKRVGLELPIELAADLLAERWLRRGSKQLQLSEQRVELLIAAARRLAQWTRFEDAGRLLEFAFKAGEDGWREHLATAARSYAPVEVATRLLDRCASSELASAPIQHQLAGILRDAAHHGSSHATRLYQKILTVNTLPAEQRIHSLCGLGENLGKSGEMERAHSALAEARLMASTAEQQARVDHRLAWLLLQEGRPTEALESSESALSKLPTPFRGGLAARILDTHAGLLLALGRPREALTILETTIQLKRRRADRRGLQISLIELSTARERLREGDAIGPAEECLLLAESAGDVPGQIYAHRRIANLYALTDRIRSDWHRSVARALSTSRDNE